MSKSIFIFAPNVGSGGGLVLLSALLRAEWGGTRVVAFLDIRASEQLKNLPANIHPIWCRPSIAGRLLAELKLMQLASRDDLVLCFHNLPPLFPTKATVHCFVQNTSLVGQMPTSAFELRLKVRFLLERCIGRFGTSRVTKYIVQTPTMRQALISSYAHRAQLVVAKPFFDFTKLDESLVDVHEQRWDFLYVSDGQAHKNHRRLFQAWRLLAKRGVFPTLALTLHPERDRALRNELAELVERYALRIEDLGQMPHRDLLETYQMARALLFPSLTESFGMPLIEATFFKLPILAPELDYVRDICDPAETFDPNSERSIAHAVLRFLNIKSDNLNIISPTQFIHELMYNVN